MVIPSNNRASGGSSRNGEWSSTSSIADESPTSSLSALTFDVSNTGPSYGFDKRRPPLNRAIPPIPESKSNESIMSQASKSLAGTPCEPKQPTLELVQEVIEDKCVVIENKMAQNLATKMATNIPPPPKNHTVPVKSLTTATNVAPQPPLSMPANTVTKKTMVASSKIKPPKEITKQAKIIHTHTDPTKSPLLSMAHSVRSRLTKFGTRFTRSDSHSRSPIRSSTSLISMNKPSQIPQTKMAKSSSMEATRNVPSTSALTKTSILTTKTAENNTTTSATENESNSHASLPRSQITLIPSPCRSPRAFAPELPKTTKTSEEKINLPSTIQEESTVTSDAEPSPVKIQTKVITSPVSVATTTSSNTDTIYSGRVSSSTRPITSPDWSEASNAKTTAPSITTTTAVTSAVIVTSPEKDKSAAENIPPQLPTTKVEEKINVNSKKNSSKESVKTKSPATPRSQKSEKASKTPKLASKFGFGGNKSSKTQKVLPSPKIKVKKGSLILKGTSEEKRTEEIVKAPRKSLSFEVAQTKPIEVRRNSEMKLIKRIEKTFMPNSLHHKVDNNKNIDMRNMNVRSVNMKNRRAPLAEFESTRVENSPAVELPPIGFDRLTSSPGQRRRAQTTAAMISTANKILPPTTTTTFMHDSNGNVVSIDVTAANLSGLSHYF
uniref:Uncharacterized protein n=1 Tax=Panagrolaimus superbus TaxID=310955 RepID=A0A914XWC4_9BILA